jgi:hypothetical protein
MSAGSKFVGNLEERMFDGYANAKRLGTADITLAGSDKDDPCSDDHFDSDPETSEEDMCSCDSSHSTEAPGVDSNDGRDHAAIDNITQGRSFLREDVRARAIASVWTEMEGFPGVIPSRPPPGLGPGRNFGFRAARFVGNQVRDLQSLSNTIAAVESEALEEIDWLHWRMPNAARGHGAQAARFIKVVMLRRLRESASAGPVDV